MLKAEINSTNFERTINKYAVMYETYLKQNARSNFILPSKIDINVKLFKTWLGETEERYKALLNDYKTFMEN